MSCQRLVALGGDNGDNNYLRSAEIYDPGLKSKIFWQLFCQTHVVAATNQWEPLPDMTEVRSNFSAVTFAHHIFAIGGYSGTDSELASVEVYIPEEQVWRHYTSLATPRAGVRCHFTIVASKNYFGNAQGNRVRREGLCSWGARWHLEAVLGGVFHPWTSWQRTNLAPGWMGFLNFFCKPLSLLGGRYAGTSI